MAKIKQRVISTIFILIFLVSIIAVSSQVHAIPTLNSNINIIWENNVAKPVIPRVEVRQLNLTVTFKVDWGREFASGALDAYQNAEALIILQINDYSPWCIATLSVTSILTPVTFGESNSTVVLNMQLKDDAPAFGEGYVKILATAANQGLIGGFEREFTLNFIAGYLPRINVNIPEGTTKNVGPLDFAVFPIDITNLGNARTTVFFKIENLSKGWTAVINDDITLDENGRYTVTLTVKPPRDFGYHDDRQSIMVTMTPTRAEDLTNIGKPSFVSVIVQSRGFSTPGFEGITFIGAFAIVLITMTILRKRKI